ncbi:hypothetical protein BT69DRAFT_39903 [Atractiella rhizophila]|nr:hypothetical protein BT69DRAFT_39903 [Atractiella rhizophila]
MCKLSHSLYVDYFRSHFKRYLWLHVANPGCEVFVTDRYTRLLKSASLAQTSAPGTLANTSVHLAVRATRPWKAGDVIPMKGYLTALTEEENEKITHRTDFLSIVHDRSKPKSQRNQLFLGPARFVNHDCNPNVSLGKYATQQDGKKEKAKWTLFFKILRDISRNEEILSSYGENYFDENNSKCLCRTCELHGHGAFADPLNVNSAPSMRIKSVTRNGRRLRALARRNSSGSDLTSLSEEEESDSELTPVSDEDRGHRETESVEVSVEQPVKRGRGRPRKDSSGDGRIFCECGRSGEGADQCEVTKNGEEKGCERTSYGVGERKEESERGIGKGCEEAEGNGTASSSVVSEQSLSIFHREP